MSNEQKNEKINIVNIASASSGMGCGSGCLTLILIAIAYNWITENPIASVIVFITIVIATVLIIKILREK